MGCASRSSRRGCARCAPTRTPLNEYTDVHYDYATVPHTLILSPGLKIEKVDVGYWFWGRPTIHQLWADLQKIHTRIKTDFDPTTAEACAAWDAAHGAMANA